MAVLMPRNFQNLLRNRPLRIAIVPVSFLSLYSTMSARRNPNSPASLDWQIIQYAPQHSTFPYTEKDFQREDSRSDGSFYSSPRFVTHIDDAAIASLRSYYDTALPQKGRILDFCSSWVSHYPKRIETSRENGEMTVIGMGMNDAELVTHPVRSTSA